MHVHVARFLPHAFFLRPMVFLGAVLLASACESVVDIDLPEHQERLVLVGSFSPQGPWEAQVSHSVGVLDTLGIRPIADATIEVWQGDRRITTLLHSPKLIINLETRYAGFYEADSPRPEAGAAYTIRVSAPGYEAVEATSAAPAPVTLGSVSFVDSVRIEQDVDQRAIGALTIRFSDSGDEANYYRLRVSVESETSTGFQPASFSVSQDLMNAYGGQQNLGVGSDSDVLPIQGTLVFDDQFFNGRDYEIEVLTYTTDLYGLTYSSGENEVMSQGYVRFRLDVISEAMYRAERSRQLQRENRDNPFSEPVPIYSNVANGLGMFAGFNTVVDERIALHPYIFNDQPGR